MTDLTPHPAAEAWPMFPEPELRRLAEDIAENGLRHPVVLDAGGRILDGRNRLAACQMAGVDPAFDTYEGDDPGAYVRSVNGNRRNQSLPERAASMALSLAQDGKREDGRWEYGAVGSTVPENGGSPKSTWIAHMRDAGLVLDYLGEARLRRVAEGKEALDAAVTQAKKERAQIQRRENLPEDLGALVETGELSIADAERRSALPEKYEARVASGDLSLDEGEALYERETRAYREAIQRSVDAIEGFLFGWSTAAHLRQTATRDDVLNALSDHDRERFLQIESEIWPTTTK